MNKDRIAIREQLAANVELLNANVHDLISRNANDLIAAGVDADRLANAHLFVALEHLQALHGRPEMIRAVRGLLARYEGLGISPATPNRAN